MKKIICLFLTITVIFALASPAMAATVTSTEVVYDGIAYTITESGNFRTVTNSSDATQVTYNLLTGELVIEDLQTHSIITINTLESGIALADFSNSSNNNEYAYHCSNKTYNGKGYEFWELKVPGKVKYTYSTGANWKALDVFSENVDLLQQAEDDISLNFGEAVLTVVLGLVNSPVTLLNTLLALLGASSEIGDILSYTTRVETYRDACEDAFASVIVYSIPT